MNFFDLLILFILLLDVLWGAVRGFTRQFLGLLSIWLAIVIDLWTYQPFSVLILQGTFPGASKIVMDSFAFIILLIVYNVLLNLIFVYSTSSPENRRRKKVKRDLNEMLDDTEKNYGGSIFKALGGAVMGFIVGVFWLSIFITLIQYFLASSGAIGSNVRITMGGSQFLPYFHTAMNLIYRSVQLFTPGTIPAIFSSIL